MISVSSQPPYQNTPSGTPPPPPGYTHYPEQSSQGYGQSGPGYVPPSGYGQPGPGYMPPSGYAQPGPGYAPPAGYGQPVYPGGGYVPSMPEPGKGMAISGFVLGIISVCLSCVPFVGIILAVLGLIFSALGQKSVTARGLAIAGLVLSIIAIAVAGLFLLAVFRVPS